MCVLAESVKQSFDVMQNVQGMPLDGEEFVLLRDKARGSPLWPWSFDVRSGRVEVVGRPGICSRSSLPAAPSRLAH